MNRIQCALFAWALTGIWLLGGCSGGSGSATNPAPSINPVPAITGVSPSSIVAGSTGTPITVTGTGFIPGSTVQWNGAAIPTTYVSATNLSATVAAGSLANAAMANLTVVNPSPGGGTSAPANIAVNNPVPALSKITPANVVAGAGETLLDVVGRGFVESSVVAWNGAALATTFVSATELKATLPAARLTGSSQNQITVENGTPGGGAAAAAFSVISPAAVITAISPPTVPTNAAATITITGTGFESNSVVLWNGSARSTTVVSITVLQVGLSAADLQNQGTGALAVSNPGPGASTSPTAPLSVTSLPIPVIQSVSITNGPGFSGVCPQLQVAITGQNFAPDSTIQANGALLPVISYGGNLSTIIDFLPAGFVTQPGALSFAVTNPGQPPAISNPFSYPASSPPVLSLCATPSPTTVFPGSGFSFTVQPSEVNAATGTLTLGSLPAGITAANSSVALPPSGATLHLKAASTTVAATYDVTLNGSAGTATAQADFNFTVSSGVAPAFFFSSPLRTEVGVPIGGSGSIQFQSIVNSISSVDYDVTPSVSGLPPGTTATFAPDVFSAGQAVTVTLNAAGNAPVTKNASVTLTGTPAAAVANATASFLADVTQPPGSLPGNRTDFVSMVGTPYSAAYDATHNLIFASNPDWNRVDVISNATHKIVKSIPVRSPRGLDITQDNSKVWVQTASPNIFAIDSASLHASHYVLPSGPVTSSGMPLFFAHDQLLALSDGTLFVYFDDSGGYIGPQVGVWNPQTNQMNVLMGGLITTMGSAVRSGDGTIVYAGNATASAAGMYVYKVSTRTLSAFGSAPRFSTVMAVNRDGSKFVLNALLGSAQMYDSNLALLGNVPGTLTSTLTPISGGVAFSPDNSKLYENGTYNGFPVVLSVDASSLQLLGTAPASPSAVPFAIDASGMVLGLQTYGISLDDSTFYQNYVANQPNVSGGLIYTATMAGPLAGGTVLSPYTFPNLTPDVWFGETRGAASIAQQQLTLTSPPGTAPGPVNLKLIYPDGEQTLGPQAFSYSTYPQYAVISGSGPNGGAPARVIGYGLPNDASGGTVTVGANNATITTTVGQYPPFSVEPIPSAVLAYTLPPGTPGWTDLQISTPIGTGTLPKSIFYAQSVTDYSSSDSPAFTAVLADEKRKQVYVSVGDHVDVFSTVSNQFVSPLHPAASGTTKQFSGLALTPDGSELLVADVVDGSLAVINPDSPSSSYAIPIATAGPGVNNCEVGPLYVAAAAMPGSSTAFQAFVTFGSLPAPSCPQSGPIYVASLQSRTVTPAPVCGGGAGVDASSDGNFVAIGDGPPCIYSVQNGAVIVGSSFPYPTQGFSVAISGDANVFARDIYLGDMNANMLGALGQPVALYGPLYGSTNPGSILLNPRLNASGSLYYLDYPSYFEIIDVAHATLRMRFALTETVQATLSPMAIDSSGRNVYLITDKGLTVVDLGTAPLSIGHLSVQNASPGTQILVRGSGFDSSVTATVGGAAASVSFSDENTLTLTVPNAASGPQDIVLTKSDGETYTLENGLVLP